MNYKKICLMATIFASMQLSANELEAAVKLKQTLSNLNSFQSVFSQRVLDEEGEELQTGSGKLALQYPQKIRWEQTTPDEMLFVSNGQRAYMFDSFADQVTILKSESLFDTTPFVLLTTRDEALWDQYTIDFNNGVFQVKPKNLDDSSVELLSIEFKTNSSELKKVTVKDVSGQYSHFTFNNVIINQPLSDNQFTFSIPQGVVVDDQTINE